jgi:signal transduction protein with GAF and PtsI domain
MPLGDLEGSWLNLSNEVSAYAYAWALANVEYIVQVDGMTDMQRILDRLAGGSTAEAALRQVLRSDYEELMQSTARYLRKTY